MKVDKYCEHPGCTVFMEGVAAHRKFCNHCAQVRNRLSRRAASGRQAAIRKSLTEHRRPRGTKTYICRRCEKNKTSSPFIYCQLCKNEIDRIKRTTATSGNEIYFVL